MPPKNPLLRQLPNILTASRLVFTLAYLALLWVLDHNALEVEVLEKSQVRILDWAFVLFVIAGVTDVIDGPLARAMDVTSQFGRSFDPFIDKILTGGGFILLAMMGQELTSIAWWMVAVVLIREVLITIMRSMSESQGQPFGASWAGKLKMFLQSFAIGAVMVVTAHLQEKQWALWVRDISIWLAVIFTALSALVYLPRLKAMRKKG